MLDFFASPYFLLFARLCVGGVFMASSVGKLMDKVGTEASMTRYPFLPSWSRKVIADYFPYLELLVGIALITGLFTRLAALGAVVLFVVFTGLIIYDLARNQKSSCHCFGRLSTEKLTPWAVVRNVFLMVIAALVIVGFDGWLAVDGAISKAPNGAFGLIAPNANTGSYPSVAEAIPVILLALAMVGVIVLGSQAVSTVRTTLRGIGYR